MFAALYDQQASLFGYLIVGICWGVTNPFIKKATMTKVNENVNNEAGKGLVQSHISTLRHFCLEPRIFLPFLINQSGSIVYYLLLSKEPISKAAPICNALTFILTAITGYIFLKEEIRSPLLLVFGSFLVLFGISICCSGFWRHIFMDMSIATSYISACHRNSEHITPRDFFYCAGSRQQQYLLW